MTLEKEYQLIKSCGGLNENNLELIRKDEKEKYKLSLLGKHQARNTALALRSVEELNDSYPVEKDDISKALKEVYWPGRMQKLLDQPLVIVDVAHNPAAFKELLKNIYPAHNKFNKIHFIFSVLADKDLNGILELFTELKSQLIFYLAENHSFRSIKIDQLEKKTASKKFNYKSFNNLSEASINALENAAADDLIIAAGSFNTVFEAGIELMSKKIRGGKDE